MLSGSYFGVKGFSHFLPPLRPVTPAKRRIALIMRDRAGDRHALIPEIVANRPAKPRIGERVRRIGHDRPIAPRKLVLPLRASLDAPQATRKREVDRLIMSRTSKCRKGRSSIAPQLRP